MGFSHRPLLQSSTHLAHEDDVYERVGFGWRLRDFDSPYPYRDYFIVNGREVAIYYHWDSCDTIYIFDNDPNVFITYSDKFSFMGTGFQYQDRTIRTVVFREGEEEFAAARYNKAREIACLMDLFMNDDALAVGETVRKNVEASEEERKRITDLIARYRACYGDEAEVLLVKYNLQDL